MIEKFGSYQQPHLQNDDTKEVEAYGHIGSPFLEHMENLRRLRAESYAKEMQALGTAAQALPTTNNSQG